MGIGGQGKEGRPSSKLKKHTNTTLPSPLVVRSTCLGRFARRLSSFFGVGWLSDANPSCLKSRVAVLSAFTSKVSGLASGLRKVCSVKGRRWRFAFGGWTVLSVLLGR